MKIKTLFLALIFSSIIAVLFLLSIKLNIFLGLPIFNYPLLDLLGVFFVLTGVSIHLSSTYFFKFIGGGTPVPVEPPKKLVRSGLYKFVRNPMYLGVFSIILGGFFIFGYLLLLIYAFLFLGAIHFYVVLIEEPRLRERFGQEYTDFTKLVPRWLPKINF
jgi:protein-S-isoprenylcysteine O-methyltransferase Ste14